MRDSIATINETLAANATEVEILKDEMALLQSNKNFGSAEHGVRVDDLKQGASYISTRNAAIKRDLLRINLQTGKLNNRIALISATIDSINRVSSKVSYEIIVGVYAKQAADVELELSYMVSGSSWQPTYDLRCKDVESPVELVYRAVVTQQTGEDWDNVKLVLSTGNPNISAEKPILQSQVVQGYENVERLSYNSVDKMATRSMSNISSTAVGTFSGSRADMDMAEAPSLAINNVLSTLFDVTQPARIKSDGVAQTIEVQTYKLNATYEYTAVPKLDRDAFLNARVSGWEDLSLLPGKANIFFGNTYIGESYINPATVKDTLDISLGRDKRVVLKRLKLKEFCSSNISGSTRKEVFAYEIQVRNSKQVPIRITIEDQIPVSGNSSIVVDLKDQGNAEYNKDTGTLSWKMTVEPQQTSKMQFTFQVKYPKNIVVPGL